MALHLIGENLNKTRGHYLAERDRLVQLVRGIYVDATDDIDATVLRHAVRIAKYLYPRAYLSAASGILLGPTRDGRIFLGGRRRQRTRIRALEIIQNEAPLHPSLGSAVIDDGMGEFRVEVSSIRQRLLEAFRLRSEHAASIDDTMRDAIAKRVIEEYGSAQKAADAVWVLARENQWYREGENAERFLLRGTPVVPICNEAMLDLIVAWHGEPIGNLRHDGFEWKWVPTSTTGPTLIRQTTPGKLPPFIISLLPEGWLESVLKDKDERAALRSGKRYMSNITIVERRSELAELPLDILSTPLDKYSKDGVFTGTYAGPGRPSITESFERNLAHIYESGRTPRLSGIQIKAPMSLDANGVLSPSVDKSFTHILKPAGTSSFEALPIIEWLALELARTSAFEVPDASLVSMPDGLPPALIVERFDIRRGANDTRKFALEDMCSVLDLPTEAKYNSTMERIARAVRPLSTAPSDDAIALLRRALFAWLIADGDMHLKNMALLKIAEAGATTFHSVRVAPVYDTLTTRVFPGLARDRMALKLNGRDDDLKKRDFRTFASTAGLAATEIDAAIESLLASLTTAIDRIVLPKLSDDHPNEKILAGQMLEIVRTRISSFA
jgi:serine/threonine-protein kinase HipA